MASYLSANHRPLDLTKYLPIKGKIKKSSHPSITDTQV